MARTRVFALLTAAAWMTAAGVLAQAGPQGRPLSAAEEADLLLMREEEKLARDVYLALHEQWGARVFANISQSEQRHMDALGTLITRYGLEDPVVDDTPGAFTNPDFTVLYDELVADGEVSLAAALRVGAYIEDLDIVDLRDAIRRTRHNDIRMVYENLLDGSCNHLRAFVRNLAALGEVYLPEFLTPEEFAEIINDDGSGRRRRRTPAAADCPGACLRAR